MLGTARAAAPTWRSWQPADAGWLPDPWKTGGPLESSKRRAMAPLLYAKVALWTAFLGFTSELAGCVCERMLPAACTYCVAPARTCCSVSHRCLPPTITDPPPLLPPPLLHPMVQSFQRKWWEAGGAWRPACLLSGALLPINSLPSQIPKHRAPLTCAPHARRAGTSYPALRCPTPAGMSTPAYTTGTSTPVDI